MPVAATSNPPVAVLAASTPASSPTKASAKVATTSSRVAAGGGASTPVVDSLTLAKSSSPAASSTSKTTKVKAKVTTTVKHGTSSTVIIKPQSNDKTSKSIPTGAIVAIAVIAVIAALVIAYRLWMIRSRRSSTSRSAPLPPMRQAYTNSGTVYANRGGDAIAVESGPSSNEDDYGPLRPPILGRDGRIASWISFDGKSSDPGSAIEAPPSPIAAVYMAPASPSNSAKDPFGSDVEVGERTHLRANGNSSFSANFPNNNELGGNRGPTNSSDSPENVGYRFSGEDPAEYPSLDDGSDLSRPSSSPKRASPQVARPQSSSSLHHRTSSGGIRNAPAPSFSDSNLASTHIMPPLDRRGSHMSQRSVHARGSLYGRNSTLSHSYVPPTASIRGAPHLPHVRAGVEIILPAPLAPQVPIGAPISSQIASNHAYGVIMEEEPRGRHHSVRRASSRTSLTSARTDAWTEAALSSRQNPHYDQMSSAQPPQRRSESTTRRRSVSGNTSQPPSRPGSAQGYHMEGNYSRNTSPASVPEKMTMPIPRHIPWANEGSSRPPSATESTGSQNPPPPSSWRNSARNSSAGALDQI